MSHYDFNHLVTIGDTNLLGGVYYTRVLEWMGQCRERWFIERVIGAGQLMQDGLVLITRDVACTFIKELHLGDPVVVRLRIPHLGHCELHCTMDVLHGITGERHATGTQTILCADASHKFRRWPEAFAAAARLIPGEDHVRNQGVTTRAELQAVA